jgi:hypothetical protein
MIKRNTTALARVTALVVAICAASLTVMAFKYHGATVERRSFHVQNPNALSVELRDQLGKLDVTTFGGRQTAESDTTALDSYLDTLQLQARSEQWKDATIKISVAGKRSAAAYSIEYSAVTTTGQKVNGGGTLVIDKPALYAYIQSLN